jgi:hypothetical protein
MTDEIKIGVYSNTFSTILIIIAVAVITWFTMPYVGENHVSTLPDIDGAYCKDNLTYSSQTCDEFCINHYTRELYGDGLYGLPGQQNVTAFCKCCNYKMKYGEL